MRARCKESGVASLRAAAQRARTSSRRSRTRSRANSWVDPPGAACCSSNSICAASCAGTPSSWRRSSIAASAPAAPIRSASRRASSPPTLPGSARPAVSLRSSIKATSRSRTSPSASFRSSIQSRCLRNVFFRRTGRKSRKASRKRFTATRRSWTPFSEAPLRASGTFSRRSRSVARRTFDDAREIGVRRSSPATWIGLAIRGRILHDTREERRMKIALAVLAAVLHTLALCDAYAHGDHKPKHGGIMGRGDDEVSVELVMEKGTAILYIEDESGSPVQTEKVKGTLNLASPGRPAQEGKLIPAGDNKLTAKGLTPLPGDRLRARIILPSGEEFWPIFSFR